MISLNKYNIYQKFAKYTIYKKEKSIIYISKGETIVKIVQNNIFVIFMIFDNHIVNI